MTEGIQLWKKRAVGYWTEASRYLRLIANSGFLFTLYLLFIIGSYYYSVLLKWLPPTFPAVPLFVVVFTVLLTRGSVRTFLKEGDTVFLLAYEARLDDYFRRSIVYSFFMQAGLMSLVFLLLGPMIFQYLQLGSGSFWTILLALLALKFLNLLMNWEEQRLPARVYRIQHMCLRLIINGVFTFLLFVQAQLFLVAAIIILMVVIYWMYYRGFASKHSLKWDHLVEEEQRMVTLFYRVANMFADVPKLKQRVKARRYAKGFARFLSGNDKGTYEYLFARSFVRSNDYFGIYLRLTIVAIILMAGLPGGWLKLVVNLLFVYIVALQLSTLSNHYKTNQMVDLYPVHGDERSGAFSFVLFRLLIIHVLVSGLVLIMTTTISYGLLGLTIGLGFSYMYSHRLVHRQKKFA
ncbi:ABC transporter permease [Halalkalibacterium halodurans]|uniref:ABC transporter permease n=1 Tax=Halalkalibacterium halodurans TaxID=86665 RepID=UPI002AA9E851|nr:ABC transporter permease [Halalkalibacterium halodurans]MDY7221716.1 ABC transporter permease [Halalkalibacterium halodurans]MDY7240992.1 ABC transporter permease [Halalkalibacterium halodurans]MED4173501.1 ABC transporter permease [Halalkalibacterium halodurans]